jgi:ferredoxin
MVCPRGAYRAGREKQEESHGEETTQRRGPEREEMIGEMMCVLCVCVRERWRRRWAERKGVKEREWMGQKERERERVRSTDRF